MTDHPMPVSSPPQTPEAHGPEAETFSASAFVETYLERLLYRVFLLGAVLGIPLLLYLAVQWRNTPLQWVYIGAIAWLVLLVWGRFIRRIPYVVRVWLWLVIPYGMAILNAVVFDAPVQASILLLSALLFGAIFLPTAHSLVNTMLLVLTGGVVLYISLYDAFPPGLPLSHGEAWGIALAVLVGVALIGEMILYLYRRRLETALEESHQLTQILDRERQRLEEQGQILENRIHQIRTVTDIVQVISNILDPDQLVWEFVDRLQSAFDLYYVGVFTLDPNREFAQLVAGSGDAGRRMVAEGYRLPLGGGSMIAWAVAHRRMRVAQDVREDPTHFPNPYLPLTRSEAALPLVARGEVLGAMTVQSQTPYAFDDETMQIFQMLADRLAIALANARLFRQLQQVLQRLEGLQRQLTEEAWSEAFPEGEMEIQMGEPVEEGNRLHLPLLLHGALVGEVELERDRPWNEDERRLIQSALQHYLSAFQTTLLFRQSRAYIRMEEIRRGFVERVGGHMDVESLLDEALAYLGRIFHTQEVRLFFTPEANGGGATPAVHFSASEEA